MNVNQLKYLLTLEEKELQDYCNSKLYSNGYTELFTTNMYTYAIGEIPVLLIAHLDTVHKYKPKDVFYDRKKKVIFSPDGTGGDDRCGVYALLEIMKEFKPYILFTQGEERGGQGATKFTKDATKYNYFTDFNFMIQIDRRGRDDSVYYDCGNKEFIKAITSFGFTEEFGTFTDISILSPHNDVASVNLSAGYFNEHTRYEYIEMLSLESTIEKVKCILSSDLVNKKFDYQEDWSNSYYNYSSRWDYNNVKVESKPLYDYSKPYSNSSAITVVNYNDVKNNGITHVKQDEIIVIKRYKMMIRYDSLQEYAMDWNLTEKEALDEFNELTGESFLAIESCEAYPGDVWVEKQ